MPPDAVVHLKKEAHVRGIDSNRFIFSPKCAKDEHVNRCYLADLSLDNPVTNGHTTSCDLLWSGVPLITMPGSCAMPSRVASSISVALGCPEMVVHSYHEYEERAVSYASEYSL